ncbi:chemotaxis protein CheA [Bacillus benzoevorans]|uniref:Chemotaxis protein CheA n=1 Tax=Bacillus benzoevorans TaxID=1456 RepID=A0A7X0LTU5_9BACI|nr:chemotaxis protein CheA [Bacillus benzoevorans]MBB6443863.1 two-component system chemotaxis sensor kinase CheA [Bacillus benzoevorans]
MDISQYLEVFIEESKEHLQSCNENLLMLEKNPEDLSIVNEIFRSAHTLKGMSATMGYEDLASLTHQMENVLDAIRQKKISFNPEILDVVFLAVDHLEAMIQSIAGGGDGKRDVSDVVEKLKLIENGKSPLAAEGRKETAAARIEETMPLNISYDEYERTVLEQSKEQGFQIYELTITLNADCLLKAARVYMVFSALENTAEVVKSVPSVERLEEEQFDQTFTVTIITNEEPAIIEKQIMTVSEVSAVSLTPLTLESLEAARGSVPNATHDEAVSVPVLQENEKNELQNDASKNNHQSHAKQNSKTIRVNIERLDILLNLFEELVIDRGRLEQISFDLKNQELQETVDRMSRTTSDLQNIILNMRMVPIETVFNRFPRMVRQLARDLHKKINLEIRGAETELDRTVIDEIGDPLVHLIRNSIDHGIETPEIRRSRGKSEEGTVILKAYHSGNHVFIEIEDDGNGISRDKVLQKALKNGIVSPQNAAALSDQQVYELIFASGFSTAEKISDISGRGVGLDVVKNTIENLGGNVSIDSIEGSGSKFSIQLPLTLSIISVLLIEVQEEKYAIPLNSIIETAIIKKEDILLAHNQKVIDFRGKIIPLLYLKDLFQVPVSKENDEYTSVIIVRKGEKIAALVVDSFIGQQEIVLKSLGDYFTNVFAISGATILGNGQVALVVDCNALLK